MSEIQLLDCTLRDGAYIVDANFGDSTIKGIISKLQSSGVEIIECGWLKDSEHICGSSFFNIPDDITPYIIDKSKDTTYVAMIDWNRYDLERLPINNGKTIDAIRVVFPYSNYKEGIDLCKIIKDKGYDVYLQAANTLAYSSADLEDLSKYVNDVKPVGISIVDTFGAMYEEDLERITRILHKNLNKDIKLGFHSHNNQQMAFANSMHFVKVLNELNRDGIVDASLCGMGRGAGNATTELVVNFLNSKYYHNYDIDAIMDAIDIYMTRFQERFSWGYSTPYFIAGMYCCHVNNIAYLQNNHRTNSRDMRNIIESLQPEDRKNYDYDLLEQKYIENQDRLVDDNDMVIKLQEELGISDNSTHKILLIAPGKSALLCEKKVKNFIKTENPVVIAVNALLSEYEYDYLFLTNTERYEYAQVKYSDKFNSTKKILLSNIKTVSNDNEYVINYNRAIKRGWPHFDNAVICALRLLDRLHAQKVFLAGFDGFKNKYNDSYADEGLPTLNPGNKWDELNVEVKEMFENVKCTTKLDIEFITDSLFDN